MIRNDNKRNMKKKDIYKRIMAEVRQGGQVCGRRQQIIC